MTYCYSLQYAPTCTMDSTISPQDSSLFCPAFELDIFPRDELILYYSIRGLKIAEIRQLLLDVHGYIRSKVS